VPADGYANRPCYGELVAIVLSGLVHVLVELGFSSLVATGYNVSVSIAFLVYVVWRVRRTPGVLRVWGFRTDNFAPAARAQLWFVAVGVLTFIAFAVATKSPVMPPGTDSRKSACRSARAIGCVSERIERITGMATAANATTNVPSAIVQRDTGSGRRAAGDATGRSGSGISFAATASPSIGADSSDSAAADALGWGATSARSSARRPRCSDAPAGPTRTSTPSGSARRFDTRRSSAGTPSVCADGADSPGASPGAAAESTRAVVASARSPSVAIGASCRIEVAAE